MAPLLGKNYKYVKRNPDPAMKFFPESCLTQLEFDKVASRLVQLCRSEFAKDKASHLRIHTRIDFIQKELKQTSEFLEILNAGVYFPNDFIFPVTRELKLLSISGSALSSDQFIQIRKLAENAGNIFRWLDAERRALYPYLSLVTDGSYYEKKIVEIIDSVIDETGQVKDNASEELYQIRMSLFRKRNELRRVFDRLLSKWNKQGYLADIGESFMNGRRVLAVFAEQKRMVKGILHAESDSRRTSFIEPEETTELNNEIFSLEHEESAEIYRILKKLTAQLSVHAALLQQYYEMAGWFDFIRAKARLAQETGSHMPKLQDKAIVDLVEAYHPLLLLHNKQSGKPTYPVAVSLHEKQRMLVISGPNAGGKTVAMKTVGLLQLMLQSGLLVSASPDSTMGVFKQLFIHIGDTQSIEFELSTYSAHLMHMKYFIENANGKTLFFIDELGGGSDPNLGGAFAEVILEEMSRKHAIGIVTTHYLNLKVMASKVPGIINGAMLFDEKNLRPLYQLKIGSPGSSYTFSIAERIGLAPQLIDRARKLVDESHFRLDKLLNQSEQDLQTIIKEKSQLHFLIKENEKMKKGLHEQLNKERHRQEMERLKLSNKISEDKLAYLKEMERKLKFLFLEWRKSEHKDEVVKSIGGLLMGQKEQFQVSKKQKKIEERYVELNDVIKEGDKVLMKKNRQVGTVKEIRGKKALLQVGIMPMLVSLADIVPVKEKNQQPSGD